MTSPPDVSIVVVAHNSESVIGRSVASALASTGVTAEVIVVDNGSTDGTTRLLAELVASDERVRTVRLDERCGLAVARGRAVQLAQGRFIAILEAGDTMLPGRLRNLLAEAGQAEADIVLDNMVEVDADGNRISDYDYLRHGRFGIGREIDLRTWIAFSRPTSALDRVDFLKPVIRRETLAQPGAWDDPSLAHASCYYLVAHLMALGARTIYVPVVGYRCPTVDSAPHRLTATETAAWLVAETAFQQQHRKRLAAQQDLLDSRMRLLRQVDYFARAREAVRRRKLDELAGLLICRPRSSIAFCSAWLTRLVAQKIALWQSTNDESPAPVLHPSFRPKAKMRSS